MAPACPLLVDPELNLRLPVDPSFAVPLLNATFPLEPLAPEADETSKSPLADRSLLPVTTATLPPVPSVEDPPLSVLAPPALVED
jgi:hypothetical protein